MKNVPLTRDIHTLGKNTHDQIINELTCPELIDYGIEFTGLTEASFPFHVARIKRDAAHLVFLASGTAQVWVKGRWELCCTNEAYLSRRFAPFAFKAMPKQPFSFAWVHYRRPGSWHHILPLESTRIKSAEGAPLVSALAGLYRETMGPSQPEARKHWVGLIDYYWRKIADARSGGGRLAGLWERVDKNLAFPWTIAALEKQSGLSHEHLRRICLQETGVAPMMQVTTLRMNRAMNLLQTTNLTVSAISEAVGYATPFAFSAAFKRWGGCPPSRYATEKSNTKNTTDTAYSS